MSRLAFEGRVTCGNGRDAFEIIGEGSDPCIRIGSLRAARRIARDFRPLLRRISAIGPHQPVRVEIGARIHARLGGDGPTQKRAAIVGHLLSLPLRELRYAPRTER